MCLLGFAAVYYAILNNVALSRNYYLALHIILEILSIVVSYAVFTTGWFGYKQTRNLRDLLLGTSFGVAGTIDLIYTLSYTGMPDFLGSNSLGKAAAYWILARFIVGLGLLLTTLTSKEAKLRFRSPKELVLVYSMVVVIAVILFTTYQDTVANAIYNTHTHSLTPFKLVLEYSIVAFYVALLYVVSSKRGWEPRTVYVLRNAIIVAIFSEIAFSVHASAYDTINILGHIYKVIAYYLIMRSLFVTALQKPYEELTQAKDEMQSLYNQAQNQKLEIERISSRVGKALSSSLEPEEAIEEVAELAKETLKGDCVVACLMSPGGMNHQCTIQKGFEQSDRPLRMASDVSELVVATRRTLSMNKLNTIDWYRNDNDASQVLQSLICTPMIYGDSVIGFITVFSRDPEAFDSEREKQFETFAYHSALAMNNSMRYERESRIANVLQRNLLSSATIATDKFEIAQVYKPASCEALIGGDYYDVIQSGDNRIGLIIGDVTGKGLKAAVHTAMMKYMIRAYVSEGHGPAEILRLMNKTMVEYTDIETFSSLFVGILDTTTGMLTYANAGHEPALYMHGHDIEKLGLTGPLVGIAKELTYDEKMITLRSNSTLLLYTDGISESRSGNKFLGADGIAEKLATCKSMPTKDVATHIYQAAEEFCGCELKDDAAILTVRALK